MSVDRLHNASDDQRARIRHVLSPDVEVLQPFIDRAVAALPALCRRLEPTLREDDVSTRDVDSALRTTRYAVCQHEVNGQAPLRSASPTALPERTVGRSLTAREVIAVSAVSSMSSGEVRPDEDESVA